MNRIVWRAAKLAVALTIALGIAAFASTGVRDQLLDAYLLAMGGILLLALVRTTRAKASPAAPSELDQAIAAAGSGPADSGELSLVRDLDLSRMSAFHLHVRLRPVLREIAAHRLRARYGVELDAEPARARELIGRDAWELVRPDRPPPRDRLAHGPPLSHLRQVVHELEKL